MTKPNQPVNKTKYGHLRPTQENFEAWEKTLEIGNILRASVCLIQCPPSFRFSQRNAGNVRRFFGQIDRGKTKLAWEPRGNWKAHLRQVRELCRQFDLIHAVDILRSEPVTETKTCYFRLHGLGPREFNYKYSYSMKDLERLKVSTTRALTRGAEEVFVLFNNISMLEDARNFDRMIHATHDSKSLAK